MLVVLNLKRRVDTCDSLTDFLFAVFAPGANGRKHAGRDTARHALDIEGLKPRQAEARSGFSLFELEGKNAHADQIASMNSLKTFRQHCLHAKQPRPLRCPGHER